MTSVLETPVVSPLSVWTDPAAHDNLKELVRLASVSENPSPKQSEDLSKIRQVIMNYFREAGITNIEEISLQPVTSSADKSGETQEPNKLLYGRWDGAGPDRPTVLLYAHYDVVRADDGPWELPDGSGSFDPFDPFDPQERGNRLYGRGAADDKSGIIMHLSALRAFGGRPPVNIIVAIEGEEEIGTGTLDNYVKHHPQQFQADVIVIADTGNVTENQPTITTSLRGLVAADVTISTLDHDVHSGMFGGPALDSFMVLVRMLNTLVDWKSDATVAGLTRYSDTAWPPSGAAEEATFAQQAGVLPNVQLVGSGSITQRVAGNPAINVVGLDGIPSIKEAMNKLHHSVTARVSVRLAPDQDPNEAFEALRVHLLEAAPFGVTPVIAKVNPCDGYHTAGDGGPFFATALKAVSDAYPDGPGAVRSGLGGTIPTIKILAEAQTKEPTVVMWGCEEPRCRIHSSVESVSYDELAHMTQAEVNLLTYVAEKTR